MYIYNFNDNMNGIPIINVDMSTTSIPVVPTPNATNTSNLTVGTNTTTPLTPEILNSVMAMTNPLEYSFPSTTTSIPFSSKVSQQSADSHSNSSSSPFDSPLATTPAGTQAITPTVQQ
ncbi:activating transcription factor 3-like, partial [Contarinia nasturtii]|uniref:activating transcription factor 3-like n=1 Tax=Contarinia nasturtii TaxID=265458 RepID=UPI0012D4AC82